MAIKTVLIKTAFQFNLFFNFPSAIYPSAYQALYLKAGLIISQLYYYDSIYFFDGTLRRKCLHAFDLIKSMQNIPGIIVNYRHVDAYIPGQALIWHIHGIGLIPELSIPGIGIDPVKEIRRNKQSFIICRTPALPTMEKL